MAATAFDTLRAAKALKDAGSDDTQAEAVITTVGDAVRDHTGALAHSVVMIAETMATKEQLATVAADAAATRDRLETAIDNMATKEQLAALANTMATKEYVNAAISELRAEMALGFKELYRHLWLMGTSIVAVTVTLLKLLP